MILIIIVAIASVIALLTLPKWKGIYLASCGGVIVLNTIFAIILVNKNLKK